MGGNDIIPDHRFSADFSGVFILLINKELAMFAQQCAGAGVAEERDAISEILGFGLAARNVAEEQESGCA